MNTENKGSQQIYTRVLPKLLLLSGLTAVIVGGCSAISNPFQQENSTAQAPVSQPNQNQPSIAPPPIIASSGDPNFVVKVVEKVGPAVVRIDTSRTITPLHPLPTL